MRLSTLSLFFLFCVCLKAISNDELVVDFDARAIKANRDIPVVSYANVLERATPSVVAVYTSSMVASRNSAVGVPRGLEDLLRQFGFQVPGGSQRYGNGSGQEPPQQESTGVGSGVIISSDGYIVTNHHVVTNRRGEPVDEIRVRLSDDSEYVAELVGSDANTDVAVLRINTEEELAAVTIANSDLLKVGDIVFAIGNPLEIGLTATQGIVSAIDRNSLNILGRGGYENFIQTDAAINLGNSGGALIDAWGRLVGINTAIVSRTGGNIGIGFAIPSNMTLSIARNLIDRGEVPRGYLGVTLEDVTDELADAFGLESTKGALVTKVINNTAADRAGIKHGDIIKRIDSIEIDSFVQLRLTVSQILPGSEVIVTLIRKGEEIALPVTLGSLSGPMYIANLGRLQGVRLQSVTDADVDSEVPLPAISNGVYVQNIEADSPYVNKLVKGMVIAEINGRTVVSPESVDELLKEGVNTLYVWNSGKWGYLVISLED